MKQFFRQILKLTMKAQKNYLDDEQNYNLSIIRMGVNCCSSQVQLANVEKIPDPTGDPIDPLETKGDIMEAITKDPHIHFFKNQIEGVMMPLAKTGKRVEQKEIGFATTDNKEYQSYIQYINNSLKGNDISTTNVLSYLFKEVADVREVQQVQTKFKNQKYAALKCFVYLYTGDYAYKKMNQSLRSKEYERLAPVISLVKKQLRSFSKEQSSLSQKKITLLYRAIEKPDTFMVEKNKIFWRAFTSTALNKEITKRFGRYVYTIILKNNLPQEYLVIPKELSHYDEEEVLIFPYFYFEVLKVQSFKANKSQNYQISQLPPEIMKQQLPEENVSVSDLKTSLVKIQ